MFIPSGPAEVVTPHLALDLSDSCDRLDPDQLLDAAGTQLLTENLIGARKAVIVAAWCDHHQTLDTPPGMQGAEELIQPGGDGTPVVAEFALLELGARFAMTPGAISYLAADVLDLRHRLRLTWAGLMCGQIPLRLPRLTAQRTRHLPKPAATRVDDRVHDPATRLTYGRYETLLEAEVIRADPALAQQRVDAARRDVGVFEARPDPLRIGMKTLIVHGETPDLDTFQTPLDTLADCLHAQGDTRPVDERRAAAVGVLAEPKAALDLMERADRCATGHPVLSRRPPAGNAVLYLHLTDQTIPQADGVARVEQIGPVLGRRVQEWLGHRHVTIKPVIDLNNTVAVDGYEVPDRLREAAQLRTPTGYFPYEPGPTRNPDIDHIHPYTAMHDGGPPDQTRLDNLAATSRHTHRTKTHARWKVRTLHPGCWLWQSPTGHGYLVNHHGTTPLGRAKPIDHVTG